MLCLTSLTALYILMHSLLAWHRLSICALSHSLLEPINVITLYYWQNNGLSVA